MPQHIPDDDIREASSYLVNLIQKTAVNAPELLRVIERRVRALVIDHRRQTIAERLEQLDAGALEELDAFVNLLVRHQKDDPIAPT